MMLSCWRGRRTRNVKSLVWENLLAAPTPSVLGHCPGPASVTPVAARGAPGDLQRARRRACLHDGLGEIDATRLVADPGSPVPHAHDHGSQQAGRQGLETHQLALVMDRLRRPAEEVRDILGHLRL